MLRKYTLSFIFFCILMDGGLWVQASQALETRREYILKASILIKFPAFIEWPATPEVLNLCVPHEDPFKNLWKSVIQDRLPIKALRLVLPNNISSYGKCHIIFISNLSRQDLKSIIAATRGRPILLVSDSPGMLEQGVGVNFLVMDNKIRFEINRDALKQNQLKVSSDLLGLAARIIGGN